MNSEETCPTIIENHKATALETSLKFKMLVNFLVKQRDNNISGVKYNLILKSFNNAILKILIM